MPQLLETWSLCKRMLAGEGAKNKSNNRAHLAQDEGIGSNFEVVVLMAIKSNEAQSRIPIEEEEELTTAPVFNKAFVELFQDLVVNSKGELIHSALIVEAEPVEFDKAVTKEKWLKAMKEETNSIEKNQTWELVDPPSNKKPIALKSVYKVKVNPKRGKKIAGIDYEVYAPVAKIETVRLVVAIATNAN
ncbi:putative mitochondrial protein, partial [Mucuna pruriens]